MKCCTDIYDFQMINPNDPGYDCEVFIFGFEGNVSMDCHKIWYRNFVHVPFRMNCKTLVTP